MEQMRETLSISVITETDIPAVTQVVNSAYEGEPGKSWTSEGHLVEGQRTTETILRDLISRPSVNIFKYSDAQGVILGCVLLEKKEGTLYLGMLSVLPKVQAAGIGARLIQFSESFAREHQYNSITITVIDKRYELMEWYRRKGFVPTGKLEPFSNKSSSAIDEFSFMEMRKELL
ncbi:GNAT family N-acetyltransferase [Chitinophaga tropicalis]|uniref:GNAT family N-acetyltransferase n=1 Tax=Chitinophaga tropicalis TaxID=2683588 RepID=A0A7K1U4Q0_9BACT|nr:GNAT family N-acetyltransferase [Chitinophaga tropicalis]MVT08975.1 GNAT family N-acetyltransferase [Chitinophaga tropicalis]